MNINIFSNNAETSNQKHFEAVPQFTDNKGIGALKLSIQAYRANLRQGNASTKRRGEVTGTGKKMYKQKGTGRARHGDHGSTIMTGGGVVFGPQPRDFSLKVNKQTKRLALKRALFERINAGDIALINAFEIEAPRTRLFDALLQKVFPAGTVLVVDADFTENTILSARNLERVYLADAISLNCWDMVRYDKLLMSVAAFEQILTRLNS